MKILQVLTYYRPYISGLTVYAQRMAEIWVNKGHDVRILCIKHQRELMDKECLDGAEVIRAKPWLAVGKGFISGEWIVKMQNEVSRSQVVVVHLPQPEAVLAVMAARLFGKRIVTIYHCDVTLPGGVGNKIAERIVDATGYLTLKLSHKIVTSSQDFAQNSRVLKNFINKIYYIYPPIPAPKAEKIKKNPDKYVIGFAGRMAAEKGVEYLLATIPYLDKNLGRKFVISMVGPPQPVGEKKYTQKITGLIQNNGEGIESLGILTDDQMGKWFAKLDILVLPSVNATEAFGMVQVEAMLAGVPVVASDLPGVRVPVLKTGMGRLVKPADAQELALAISEILNKRKKYVRITRVTEEFDINKSLKTWDRVLGGIDSGEH